MFLGLEWYWWLILIIAFIVSLPFKKRFLQRIAEKKNEPEAQDHD